ncbi:flagellar biosynthesis protein FlhF [Clostridiisalibacter paucivorans]|uniref:flagellar biosynthesis protein FlhF n=1 Tax=Clostridiisalibacter paucivorans TaxID=408753 RepID=UPI000479E8D2|nr:flagellar biosynthesis protein FlhF [Clostridiisalibacter paucivorans]
MKVKRYIGSNTQDAMVKVKKELGSNAIILHTRKIKKPGILGIFRRPLIEIVAAEENNVDVIENKNRDTDLSFSDGIQLKKTLFKNMASTDGIDWELKKIRESIDSLSNNIEKKEDIKDIGLPDNLMDYRNNLLDKGVETEIAERILRDISERINIENKDKETLYDIVKYNISDYLGEPKPIEVNKSQKVIFFIGPTGVGKTTTLAKLAAQYAINDKNSIGLITADTYRIAAVEQLRTYSEILEVPLKIVYDTKDIYSAMSNFKDKQLILIDTAGRSHKNSSKVQELKELIDTVKNKEVYLVLSATTNFSTVKSILSKYNFLEDYKLIFTKIDESETLGIILSTKYYTKKPLSYVTNGQNVPEDIEIIDINQLTNKLIGE